MVRERAVPSKAKGEEDMKNTFTNDDHYLQTTGTEHQRT